MKEFSHMSFDLMLNYTIHVSLFYLSTQLMNNQHHHSFLLLYSDHSIISLVAFAWYRFHFRTSVRSKNDFLRILCTCIWEEILVIKWWRNMLRIATNCIHNKIVILQFATITRFGFMYKPVQNVCDAVCRCSIKEN